MEERLISEFDFMLIYLNCKYPYENLDKDLRKLFPLKNENYVAVHAEELIVDNNTVRGVGVCFLKFENRIKLKIFSGYDIEDFKNNFLVEELVEYLKENREHLNLLYLVYSERVGEFLEELNLKLNEEGLSVPVYGCVPYNEKNRGLLFYNGEVIEDGFVVLSFEGADFKGGIAHGFRKLGPPYRVTRAKGNRIYEVDEGRPAYEIVSTLLRDTDGRVENLWFTPFLFVDDDGRKLVPGTVRRVTREYVELFCPVREGAEFYLSFGDEEMLLEASQQMSREVSRGFKNADLLLTFVGYPRMSLLGDRIKEEVLSYMLSFDAPLMGLTSSCEVIYEGTGIKVYNESSLILALKERVL
ncbi:MAG: hypothetical protein GXN96_06510 [Aquificae bacterium]|nr:hypothetical protein [Aquificota bacterium]